MKNKVTIHYIVDTENIPQTGNYISMIKSLLNKITTPCNIILHIAYTDYTAKIACKDLASILELSEMYKQNKNNSFKIEMHFIDRIDTSCSLSKNSTNKKLEELDKFIMSYMTSILLSKEFRNNKYNRAYILSDDNGYTTTINYWSKLMKYGDRIGIIKKDLISPHTSQIVKIINEIKFPESKKKKQPKLLEKDKETKSAINEDESIISRYDKYRFENLKLI